MSNRWLLPLLASCPDHHWSGLTVPADNRSTRSGRFRPRGSHLADADRKALQDGVDELGKQIDALRDSLKAKPDLLALLPDVQIYDNAVR